MSKEEQFVNELIGYIFAYPDDDYMTMECLCRKLVKYHLMSKVDGYYTADRKTELSNSEIPNNCEDLQDWKDQMWAEAIVTEPTISKMEQVDEDINVRSKDEPQTDCSWR